MPFLDRIYLVRGLLPKLATISTFFIGVDGKTSLILSSCRFLAIRFEKGLLSVSFVSVSGSTVSPRASFEISALTC